ncbi:unnamed protein product [Phytomonas sp. EM1]|nr:unnamed protein product [Phytomonas sp. EM1]|eukprot:CCW63034.1 unnamed protein product [Phytomonas sp. isolate EM1]
MRLYLPCRRVILNFNASRDFNTKSTDDSNVKTPPSTTVLSGRRTNTCSKWYAKQADQRLLFPEDILHINSGQLLHSKTLNLPASSVDMFFGCMRVADSMRWDLAALFKQMPFSVKIEVVCRMLQKRDDEVCDEPCSKHLRLNYMLQTIVEEATTEPRDEAWLARVMMCLDETHIDNIGKDFSTLRQMLKMSLFFLPLSILPHGHHDRLLYHVLRLGERVFNDRWNEWSEVLAEAGLGFEACAYAYADSLGGFIEPQRRPFKKGFGNAVLEALAQPKSLVETIQRLSTCMPRILARYTHCLTALSIMRQSHECLQSSCLTESHFFFPYELVETSMNRLEFASLIHFTLFAGNSQTAYLLLTQCTTPKQIATVMHHTRDAGHFLSLKALTELLFFSPSGRAYVVLQLNEAEAPLLFDVKSHRLDFETSIEAFCTQPGGIQRTRAKIATYQWKEVYNVLQDVLPRSVLSTGCQSLEILLTNVPISAIPFVVSTFSPFTSELVSWWASLYIHSGNSDAAMRLLSCSLSRNVFPEMWVLVELLEFHRNHDKTLRSCVELIRSQFPALSTAVFRAFVERTAYLQGVGLSDKGIAAQALELLSSVAILGLSHYPAVCIQQILEKAPTPVVGVMLQFMQGEGSKAFKNTPAPLHVGVIERLVAAAHTLGLNPKLDVYVVIEPSKELTWWSSHGLPSTKCAVHRLYSTQATGLWPLAFERIHSTSHFKLMEVHQAVRLIAVGCSSARTVREAVCTSQDYLLGNPNSSSLLQRQNESSLITTLACVASSLTARGEWEASLELISPSVTDLPPLLRIVKFQALLHDPQARELAEMNLEDSIHAFVEASEEAKTHRCPHHSYRGRSFRRFRFRTHSPRVILGRKCCVGRPWQSYLAFTKPLRKLLTKCENNALIS